MRFHYQSSPPSETDGNFLRLAADARFLSAIVIFYMKSELADSTKVSNDSLKESVR
jgi:hypothetical protein